MGKRLLTCAVVVFFACSPQLFAQVEAAAPEVDSSFWTVLRENVAELPALDEPRSLPTIHELEAIGHSERVQFMAAVLANQTWKDWYLSDTPARDFVDMWASQSTNAEIRTKLNQVHALMPQEDTLWQFIERLHLDLEPYKTLKPLFVQLQAMGLDLPLLCLGGAAQVQSMKDFLAKNPKFLADWDKGGFGDWTLAQMYGAEADPEVISDAQVDMVAAALDAGFITPPRLGKLVNNKCCGNKPSQPTTYRKCIPGSGYQCNTCGAYCCLIPPDWCP